jgi:Outer membrane protein beta-barrel domain
MRFFLLLCFFAVAIATTTHAQFAIGLKGGLHTQTQNPQDIFIGKDTLGVNDIKFGTQFGAWVRIGKGFFIQPEIIFNANRTDFELRSANMARQILTEKYNHFDLPILFGAKLGPLRVMAGPVGHLFADSKSQLTNLNGFEENWKALTWGWQGGANLALGRFSVDLRYEGNFDKFGDHISVFGDKYAFANNPNRLILAVNFALIGK